MNEFARYWFVPLNPWVWADILNAMPMLLGSAAPYFWIMVALPFARFQLPPLMAFAANILRPLKRNPAFDPNPKAQAHLPLVSVLIAGRNERDTIHTTIASTLACGYERLEVIMVDDCSSDDTLARARWFERTGRVRVFGSTDRNGKPSSLNIAIGMARGEYCFILDADSEVEYGAIHALLECFTDPKVAAATANIKVRNADASLPTRMQEIDYALNVSLSRYLRSHGNMLGIIAGAAGMFRTQVLRDLKGFDTGLGDDTDMTIKLRKQGWRLGFAHTAIVWTNVPETWKALFRQRTRWERNMVKIRLRKHGDLFLPNRYGWTNTLVAFDIYAFRVILPIFYVFGLIKYFSLGSFSTAALITQAYWLTTFFVFIKLLVTHDLFALPRAKHFLLIPLIPFYRLALRLVLLVAVIREGARLGLKHGYVPDKIWNQIRHW